MFHAQSGSALEVAFVFLSIFFKERLREQHGCVPMFFRRSKCRFALNVASMVSKIFAFSSYIL